jgi:phage pi2 protein 07
VVQRQANVLEQYIASILKRSKKSAEAGGFIFYPEDKVSKIVPVLN